MTSGFGVQTDVKHEGNGDYSPALGTKDQIPAWLRDNDYIITGHPIPTDSYVKSLRLWRCLHMESMNIWSHAIGAAIFVGIGTWLYHGTGVLEPASGKDRLAIAIFAGTSTICFALSAIFHSLRSHSYDIHHFCGKLDILGICFLAVGAGTSTTWFAFSCSPLLQRVYWTLDIAAALAAGWTLFDTGGGGNRMRTLRGVTFTALGAVAVAPIIHAVTEVGWEVAKQRIGAGWYAGEATALLVGVAVFVGRLPERLAPGRFDVFGHSHQIWHLCGVVAAGLHIRALIAGVEGEAEKAVC